MATTVLLVRHGENPANLTHEFSCRRVDYPLTERGALQADQAAEAIARRSPVALWTSPLVRARQTAEAIALATGRPLRIVESLREMNVGELEGKIPQSEAWEIYSQVMTRWLAGDKEAAFPGGESRRQVGERFQLLLTEAVQSYPEQTVVLVGHAGLFTHGLLAVCSVGDERAFLSRDNSNASISELKGQWTNGQLSVELVDWALVSHLSGDAAQLIESVPSHARASNLSSRL